MRRFHSYGPVENEEHFFVERKELINKCTNQLVGNPGKDGHYFTIWAPRQTGKTWITRKSVLQIKKLYADSFIVGAISMEPYHHSNDKDSCTNMFKTFQKELNLTFDLNILEINSWHQCLELFEKRNEFFNKPLILLIDEFDKLPTHVIDKLVSSFRHMYLNRSNYVLHGLALIGVRAVLGMDSQKGSPFNVQRSVHIPNLTFKEVQKMFDDYQSESGQKIEPQVIQQLFNTTNGQPGLIGWFGELLSEKYNQFQDKPIDMDLWNEVYAASIHIEHNNTIQNMIVKAKNEYKTEVLKLFKDSNIDFSFNVDWCNYMCMHGLITYEKIHRLNEIKYVCRFSSPYVQSCLYNVFTGEVAKKQSGQVMALDPLDFLEDVFDPTTLNIPALLDRYKNYLKRLKDNGENPWANQPRRKTDYHLTEAVGHFHLYFWLKMAIESECSIIPEFPTGNGKVDLHIKCKQDKKGLIEVKSFVNPLKVNDALIQASEYALQTSYSEITIAMFAPFNDDAVLNKISISKMINNVNVNVVAIGQG
ncbi:hypothetical protein MHK_006834 [Candidatus Magnetomorum sp. HK-1]|nr:hypothetical protein MHK_006834 [Candidatus Magnetomorum sp. HK-1]